MPKRIGQYEIGKTLGEGTFGKVKYARHMETGESFAVKFLSKAKIQKERMGGQVKREVSIMKKLNHPNIAKLIEVLASRDHIFLIMEFISGGELFDEIVKAGKFKEERAKKYFRQLCNGVDFCHSQQVAHRDIKPENLLLDKSGDLKISDFGLSNVFQLTTPDNASATEALLHTTCGTPNYVAPEVLLDKGYEGMGADVWSIGVVLFVLLAGYLPFDEEPMSLLFKKIKDADFEFPSWFSPTAKDLISKILVADPKKRLTIKQIMEHPFYTQGLERQTAKASSVPKLPSISTSESEVANAIKENVDEHDTPDARSKISGAHSLNAFDLINLVGGTYLGNIFSPISKGKKERVQHGRRKLYNILSPKPIKVIMGDLEALFTREAYISVTSKTDADFQFDIVVKSKAQSCHIAVQIFEICENLHTVQVQRMQGDALAYYKRVSDLCTSIKEKIQDSSLPQKTLKSAPSFIR